MRFCLFCASYRSLGFGCGMYLQFAILIWAVGDRFNTKAHLEIWVSSLDHCACAWVSCVYSFRQHLEWAEFCLDNFSCERHAYGIKAAQAIRGAGTRKHKSHTIKLLFSLCCASYVHEFNKHFANIANLKYQSELRLATTLNHSSSQLHSSPFT